MSGPGIIVSGTDTGVGKTIFAAGLASAIGGDYWKPVQAGLDGETDSETVARLTAGAGVTIHPEAYRLATPCSPHEAARIDGCAIELSRLAPPTTSGKLVVEGAGGVLVPYSEQLLAADIFAFWNWPLILVARTGLGTINHSLLSIEALRARNVPIAGVAFIGDRVPSSERAITELGACRHLGCLPPLHDLNPATLSAAFAANIRVDLLT